MDKSSLRAGFLRKRKALSREEVIAKNDAIVKNTLLFLDGKSIGTVHIFLPQEEKLEIDTLKIISFLHVHHPEKKIVVPRVIPNTREMEHYLLTPETKLIPNRWKIPEPDPAHSIKIEEKKIDAVLIPLLAFDKCGFRVGYGGGYYDRFLVQCRSDAIKIGLSFFDPVEQIDDLDAFDVAMNYCITPAGVIEF